MEHEVLPDHLHVRQYLLKPWKPYLQFSHTSVSGSTDGPNTPQKTNLFRIKYDHWHENLRIIQQGDMYEVKDYLYVSRKTTMQYMQYTSFIKSITTVV